MKLLLFIDTSRAPESTFQCSACPLCQLGPDDHFEPAGTAMFMLSDPSRETLAIPGRGKLNVDMWVVPVRVAMVAGVEEWEGPKMRKVRGGHLGLA